MAQQRVFFGESAFDQQDKRSPDDWASLSLIMWSKPSQNAAPNAIDFWFVNAEFFSITSLISQHLVYSRQRSSADNYNSSWATLTRRLATAVEVSAWDRKSSICVSECISIVMYCNAAWMCASTFTANLMFCLLTQSRASLILFRIFTGEKKHKAIATKSWISSHSLWSSSVVCSEAAYFHWLKPNHCRRI